jgi:hypothetical protein
MPILLKQMERSAALLRLAPMTYQGYVQEFKVDAPPQWNVRTITLPYPPESVLDKAQRILHYDGFEVNKGIDAGSIRLRAKLKESCNGNEGWLATIQGYLGTRLELQFEVEVCFDSANPAQMRLRMSRRLPAWGDVFLQKLASDLAQDARGSAGQASPIEDLVLGPGERFAAPFTHSLLDYSGCATISEVSDLAARPTDASQAHVLPLGVFAFDLKPDLARPERMLYLGQFADGQPMEYNGVLVVAPQRSGKTRLILRWAQAANRAGYNLFLVDVKGNMFQQLRKNKFKGEVFHFSTAPDGDGANAEAAGYARFNILEELDPTTPVGRADIRNLAEAILPRFGGEDEKYWPLRVKWLAALINIRKLFDLHYEQNSALADIYALATSEQKLVDCIVDLQAAERFRSENMPDYELPEPGIGFWIDELAPLIPQNHEEIPGGQREPQYTYATLMIQVAQALMPFYRYGTLYARTNGRSDFRLSDLNTARHVTIIMAAREHDGEDSQVVISMVMRRLEQILKRRFDVSEPERKILLLLDETRRIQGFKPGKYISFAREAKAGCVLVYQSLDQIENPKEVTEILENVGTQIYLRSATKETAEQLITVLPRRDRANYSLSSSFGSDGISKSRQISQEDLPCLTKKELYRLPAGDYPALVFIKDHGTGKPFLVDMSEPRMQPYLNRK